MFQLVLVEAQDFFRAHLLARLAESGRYQILHLVDSAAEARALPTLPLPDVIVVDIDLSDGSGFALIAPLLRQWPATKLVLLVLLRDPASTFASLRAGASACISKDHLYEDLLPTLDALLA